MAQEQVWEKEYAQPTFLTKDNNPQQDVVRFVQFLKKEKKIEIDNTRVLDLGSGTGRNSYYFAELGAHVTGLEISKTAITVAEKNLAAVSRTVLDITYIRQSIGEKFPLPNESVDIVLDVTSSNSLTESEREVCLAETARVMKPGAYFFLKALCKDGDENAKHLLKTSPGTEQDTYIMPDTQY
jgi:SAM-dependent methyltransferase